MDIRCRKELCRFNNCFTCKAKGITIGREVVCSTFEKEEGKEVQDVTKSLFEREHRYAPMRDSRALEINCRANCLFNHNGKCVSNGITLNSIEEKPFCISYLRK